MPTQENDPRWTYEEGVPDYVDTTSPHDQAPAGDLLPPGVAEVIADAHANPDNLVTHERPQLDQEGEQ